MNFLDKVIITKKEEVDKLKKKKPFSEIKKEAFCLVGKRRIRPLKDIFYKPDPTKLIAEIKLKSPVGGQLTTLPYLTLAHLYARSKADAISVVTDRTYFGGHISYLRKVRSIVHQPILRKDFIIDPYQIYETFVALADAFLLIASVLHVRQLKNLLAIGQSLGLESVVEVYNKEDLEKALSVGAEIIGINNRSLKTLTIDLNVTERLIRYVPKGKFIISESGINTPAQVHRLAALGVHGILVGTAILKAENPIEKVSALKLTQDNLFQ